MAHCGTKDTASHKVGTYKGMRVTTSQSMTDRIYDNGPITLKYYNIIL